MATFHDIAVVRTALVPPLAAAGINMGAGYGLAGTSALHLFAINLVCVNIAGIVMFLMQGLPPKSWRLTGGLIAIWVFMLFLIMSLIAGRIFLGFGSLDAALQYLADGM